MISLKRSDLLSGKRVLVTAGPTREWLDPFRFISNPSSGKMGFALAHAALDFGARVTLIHGPVMQVPKGLSEHAEILAVESTGQMCEAVLSKILAADMLVMAAAPSDYTPIEREQQKIKKNEETFQIELRRTPDILKRVAALCAQECHFCIRVGFAAETTNIHEYAREKLHSKDLDMICLNDISQPDAGFAVDTNRIIVYNRKGECIELPLMTKTDAARSILTLSSDFFRH